MSNMTNSIYSRHALLTSIVLLSTSLIILSCAHANGDDLIGDATSRPNLIQTYVDMSQIGLNFYPDSKVVQVYNNGSKGLSGEEKKKMINKYDDCHFNKAALPDMYTSYANEFAAIEVTSRQDFNGIAPGSLINEKITLVSVSPYKWLLSKGSANFDWSDVPKDYRTVLNANPNAGFDGLAAEILRPENYPVNKDLNSVCKDDLVLLSTHCLYLLFKETPSIKAQVITVTFVDGDKRISKTKEITFSN